MPPPLIILVFLAVLLCTGTYVQYGTTTTTTTSSISHKKEFSFEAVIPNTQFDHDLPSELPPVPNTTIDEACKNVDFQWLAGDRSFWDGWSSKAMFMKKDGQFTRKNVRTGQGEFACVVVLLGPIPAVASIKVMTHYAPSDTIIMTAKSDTGTRIPITMKQHPKQLNAYFAAVQFFHPDRYTLETSVDYRSYFWEFPQVHKYLPNRFLSRNHLTVVPRDRELAQQKQCDLVKEPFALRDSVWMNKQEMNAVQLYHNPFNSISSDLVFVPNCELRSVNMSLGLTVHVWGDKHLKRNVQYLKGDLLPTDLCNHREEEVAMMGVHTPIRVQGNDVYYGEINAIMADTVNDYKSHIDGISRQIPKTDVVILGVGNEDIAAARQSPYDFAASFNSLLKYLLHQVYTGKEKIIVKTTQYYGSYGPERGWNHGRSEAYANIIRYTIMSLSVQDQKRVHLWDTNLIGLTENGEQCDDRSVSSYNVLQVENAMLVNIIQNIN